MSTLLWQWLVASVSRCTLLVVTGSFVLMMGTKITVFHPSDLCIAKHSCIACEAKKPRSFRFYGQLNELCCDQSDNLHFALLQWECRGLREQQVTCYRVIQGLALCGRFTKMLFCWKIYWEECHFKDKTSSIIENAFSRQSMLKLALHPQHPYTVPAEKSRLSVLHSCGDHEISMGPSRLSSFFCLFIPACHCGVKITHIWHRPPSLVTLTLVCHTERSLLTSFMFVPFTQHKIWTQ